MDYIIPIYITGLAVSFAILALINHSYGDEIDRLIGSRDITRQQLYMLVALSWPFVVTVLLPIAIIKALGDKE